MFGEREGTVYSLPMPESAKSNGSPTAKLLLGLVLTLAAVLLFAYYMTGQLSGLRALQSNLVDRNRKDSLQLLRVQNDLNSLALAMRDMLDAREPYPLTAWTAQFERIRGDLGDQIQVTLQARQAALSTAVSRFLVQNNEAEEQATAEITGIYDRVQRQLYFFLSAALLVIVLTNRR